MKKKVKKKKTKDIQKAEQRKYSRAIQSVFCGASFAYVASKEVEVELAGKKGEIDAIYIYDNIIVIIEDTIAAKSSDIRDHLLKKALFIKQINSHKDKFIELLKIKFKEFKKASAKSGYGAADYIIKFVYSSKYPMEEKHKKDFIADVIFLDNPYLLYFEALSKVIGRSARYELFKFLNLKLDDIRKKVGASSDAYPGFILPETPSGFPLGYKVVTFYIDADSLIERAYVLRKDSWVDKDALYQRMLIKKKLNSMREYLSKNKRTFINNIIATLPETTKLLDNDDNVVTDISPKTGPIKVQIPREYNSVGIIDGQHRIYAYHEGADQYEKIISKRREQQNLLVSGLIYPKAIRPEEVVKFEARLFLEINDKQSRTRANLKQAINTIVEPFSSVAIAKSVVEKLAESGPLKDLLEIHFYDRHKIKTSSIVGYGLRHIVKIDGEESLYKIWTNPRKAKLKHKKDRKVLGAYVKYCSDEINKLLIPYKMYNLKKKTWITDKEKSRALTTTSINGLIYCLRKILRKNKSYSARQYENRLKKLTIDFTPQNFTYKSSHWKDLGEDIYKECF